MVTEGMTIRPCDRSGLESVLLALGLGDHRLLGQYVDLGFGKEYDAFLVDGSPQIVVKLDDGEGAAYKQ